MLIVCLFDETDAVVCFVRRTEAVIYTRNLLLKHANNTNVAF